MSPQHPLFEITADPIDLDALKKRIADPSCGALVAFEGLVRNHHEGRDVTQLHYEHHPVLALDEGKKILAETLEKFDVTHALAVHRVGTHTIGDIAVVTLTASPHRQEAFAANQYLIDEIKARVPIWKLETYTDGSEEWTSPCPGCARA